ncbi:MAG: prepilin-type N-terminal cleavage/methylation domain-containing protein [Oscillospiraceae bacterium]|nr:prepilin-type N-terminal cleavage/methylation domain-containing protein [Oscillospiraceae bacterium]
MYNVKNDKGFTLAELLIVIAIIAALVAIMIPTFGTQIEKAREAADVANLRSGYADAMAQHLQDGKADPTVSVKFTQTQAKWQDTNIIANLPFDLGSGLTEPDGKAGTKTIKFSFDDVNNKVTASVGSSTTETTEPTEGP